MARQEYASDVAGLLPSLAKLQTRAWEQHPYEVAECAECGHPYLFHFDARALDRDRPGVGCHGCGAGHRCYHDTTVMRLVYYLKHDDAD